jgi:hypothetical protein
MDRMGNGGTRVTVEGVDIWENGEPPRKYKIVGIIEDQRPGHPAWNDSRNTAVAQKTKEHGGDAAIWVDANTQVTGVVSNSYATSYGYGGYGTGFAAPARTTFSRFQVIKYVD